MHKLSALLHALAESCRPPPAWQFWRAPGSRHRDQLRELLTELVAATTRLEEQTRAADLRLQSQADDFRQAAARQTEEQSARDARSQALAGQVAAWDGQGRARFEALAALGRQQIETTEAVQRELATQGTEIYQRMPRRLAFEAEAARTRLAELAAAQDVAVTRLQEEVMRLQKESTRTLQARLDKMAANHATELKKTRGLLADVEKKSAEGMRTLATELTGGMRSQREEFAGTVAALRQSLLAQGTTLEQSLQARLDETVARTDLLLQALEKKTDALHREIQAEFAGFMDRSYALHATSTKADASQPDADLDFASFYQEFERRYRGSRALIVKRLQQYAPLINDWSTAFAAARQGALQVNFTAAAYPGATHPATRPLTTIGDMAAIDLGCGRGEWLECLLQFGLRNVQGVDSNPLMIAECHRQGGLPAVQADALVYLRGISDASVSLITGFHIVEHLPFPLLQQLVRHAFRVLQPGGMCIFETPNPENILAASLYFHLDPTHVKPLPVDLMLTLLETAGFERVEVMRMQPNADLGFKVGTMPEKHPDQVVQHLLNHFRAARDYAVVVRRPSP